MARRYMPEFPLGFVGAMTLTAAVAVAAFWLVRAAARSRCDCGGRQELDPPKVQAGAAGDRHRATGLHLPFRGAAK